MLNRTIFKVDKSGIDSQDCLVDSFLSILMQYISILSQGIEASISLRSVDVMCSLICSSWMRDFFYIFFLLFSSSIVAKKERGFNLHVTKHTLDHPFFAYESNSFSIPTKSLLLHYLSDIPFFRRPNCLNSRFLSFESFFSEIFH